MHESENYLRVMFNYKLTVLCSSNVLLTASTLRIQTIIFDYGVVLDIGFAVVTIVTSHEVISLLLFFSDEWGCRGYFIIPL